jgi:predicted RNase H-like HicB family nuclease
MRIHRLSGPRWRNSSMRNYLAVVERCPETRLYVGYVPGFPGAHSQGETLDELNNNLREVIEMLLEATPATTSLLCFSERS